MRKLNLASNNDFNAVLKNYNIGNYLSRKYPSWVAGNEIYIIDTTKGKFVLKIHDMGEIKYLKYSIKIMEFARKRGLPVPELMKTMGGSSFLIHKGGKITIQRFIEGQSGESSNKNWVKSASNTIGLLDRTLLEIPLKGEFTWHYPQFRAVLYGAKKVPRFNLTKERKLLIQGLKAVNKSRLRKSVIHSDLGGNFIRKDGKLLALIDWDVVHEDYTVFEPAIFIAQNLITKKRIMKTQIKLFLRAYQKYITLNKEEQKALYYFIKYRYLSMISWTIQTLKTSKNNQKLKKFNDATINKYYRFNRVSLEQFLSWID